MYPIIIDEVRFAFFDGTGDELLFNALAECYERRATITTTDLAFSQ